MIQTVGKALPGAQVAIQRSAQCAGYTAVGI